MFCYSGLDYKQLMDDPSHVIDILSPCLTSASVATFAKLAKNIPDGVGVTLFDPLFCGILTAVYNLAKSYNSSGMAGLNAVVRRRVRPLVHITCYQ